MLFLYSHWRSIPLTTRVVIATAFGIAKVGPTHVVNNVVESDGYKIDDVERALTVERIQEYTGSNSTDIPTLFELMVAKAEGRTLDAAEEKLEVPEPILDSANSDINYFSPPKKRGRPAKAK